LLILNRYFYTQVLVKYPNQAITRYLIIKVKFSYIYWG